MMGAGEVNIEERILMTMQEYSILKEVLEYHECGWSKLFIFGSMVAR
jgi:hypothetical protein